VPWLLLPVSGFIKTGKTLTQRQAGYSQQGVGTHFCVAAQSAWLPICQTSLPTRKTCLPAQFTASLSACMHPCVFCLCCCREVLPALLAEHKVLGIGGDHEMLLCMLEMDAIAGGLGGLCKGLRRARASK
jgi:hypothetical protein